MLHFPCFTLGELCIIHSCCFFLAVRRFGFDVNVVFSFSVASLVGHRFCVRLAPRRCSLWVSLKVNTSGSPFGVSGGPPRILSETILEFLVYDFCCFLYIACGLMSVQITFCSSVLLRLPLLRLFEPSRFPLSYFGTYTSVHSSDFRALLV